MRILKRLIAAIVLFVMGEKQVYPDHYNSRRMNHKARMLRLAIDLAVMRERIREQHFIDREKVGIARKITGDQSSVFGINMGGWLIRYMRHLLSIDCINLRRRIRQCKARQKIFGEAGDTDVFDS